MEYIKIWTDFQDTIAELTDDEKGRLLDIMLTYARYGTQPDTISGNERYLWPAARQSIDRMAESSEKKRESGRKGGISTSLKANNSGLKQTEAKGSNRQQTEAETSQKEKKEKEKKEEEITRRERTNSFSPPSPDEVAAYCHEHGIFVDPHQFCDYYTSNGWMVGTHHMKDWRASLRTWAARDRNCPPQRSSLPPGDIRAYSQRDYTGEQEKAIERMMAAAKARQEKEEPA